MIRMAIERAIRHQVTDFYEKMHAVPQWDISRCVFGAIFSAYLYQ